MLRVTWQYLLKGGVVFIVEAGAYRNPCLLVILHLHGLETIWPVELLLLGRKGHVKAPVLPQT